MGGKSDLSKMTFQEVVPQEKLVWLHSSANSDWSITSNPMMADWPHALLTTVIFKDVGASTNVRLTMVPVDATNAEIARFVGAMDRFAGGWESGYAIMDKLLEGLQAENTQPEALNFRFSIKNRFV